METRTFAQSRFFKVIPEAPNYVACIDGRIYSRPRRIRGGGFGGTRLVGGVFRKPGRCRGFMGLALAPLKMRNVGALVLSAFRGPRPEGQCCRHLNGDFTDNRLGNLAWGTPKDNAQDMIRHGRHSNMGGRTEKLPKSEYRRITKECQDRLRHGRRAEGWCIECGVETDMNPKTGGPMALCLKHRTMLNERRRKTSR